MNAMQLTVAVPGGDPAVLSLPQPLTAQTLPQPEQAMDDTLSMPRRDLCDRASDAGAIEYASWMPYLRPSRS